MRCCTSRHLVQSCRHSKALPPHRPSAQHYDRLKKSTGEDHLTSLADSDISKSSTNLHYSLVLCLCCCFLLPLRSRPLLQGGAEVGWKVAFLSSRHQFLFFARLNCFSDFALLTLRGRPLLHAFLHVLPTKTSNRPKTIDCALWHIVIFITCNKRLVTRLSFNINKKKGGERDGEIPGTAQP